MATTLDTHAAIKRLTAAGITTSHAEAIVETVSQVDDKLVTRPICMPRSPALSGA